MNLQEADDELARLALVATIGGTRPFVSTQAVYEMLHNRFQIRCDEVEVRIHEPEDFLVRFRCREDRDRVLASPDWGYLIPLRWRPWTRILGAVAGAF